MVQLGEFVKVPNHSEWDLFLFQRGQWVWVADGLIYRNLVAVGHALYIGDVNHYWSTTIIQKMKIESSDIIAFRTSDSFYRLEKVQGIISKRKMN